MTTPRVTEIVRKPRPGFTFPVIREIVAGR